MPLPPAPTKPADKLSPSAFSKSGPQGKLGGAKRPAAAREIEAKAPARIARLEQQAAPAMVAQVIPITAALPGSGNTQARAPQIEARIQPADGQSAATKAVGKAGARGEKKTRRTGPAKLFVLDTNVLLHDPMCLFRFEEHDIFLYIFTGNCLETVIF